MIPLSDAILDKHAAGLNAFVNHAFFAAIQDGSLSDTAARAYFINERRFVEQAVVVFAHILAKAPTLSARRHLHAILHGLLYDQIDLFEGIYARMGIARGAAERTPSASMQAVYDGFTAIARDESYASGLAAMLVAESTYACASERLMESPPNDPLLRDWFGLHVAPQFLRGVTWLRQELDEQGRKGVNLDNVSAAVSTAIALELVFHDEPLRTPLPGG